MAGRVRIGGVVLSRTSSEGRTLTASSIVGDPGAAREKTKRKAKMQASKENEVLAAGQAVTGKE